MPTVPVPIQPPSVNNSAAQALACQQETAKVQSYILEDEQLKSQLRQKAVDIENQALDNGTWGDSTSQETMKANQQQLNKVAANERFWKSYKIPACK